MGKNTELGQSIMMNVVLERRKSYNMAVHVLVSTDPKRAIFGSEERK